MWAEIQPSQGEIELALQKVTSRKPTQIQIDER